MNQPRGAPHPNTLNTNQQASAIALKWWISIASTKPPIMIKPKFNTKHMSSSCEGNNSKSTLFPSKLRYLLRKNTIELQLDNWEVFPNKKKKRARQ